MAGCHPLRVIECRGAESFDGIETEPTECHAAVLIEPTAFELLARRDGRFTTCDKLRPVEYGAIGYIEFVEDGGIVLATPHGFELVIVAHGSHQLSLIDCQDTESLDCGKTDLRGCSGAELIEPNAFVSFGCDEDRCVGCDEVRPVERGPIESAVYEFEFFKSGEIGSATTHGFGSTSVANGRLQLRVVEC